MSSEKRQSIALTPMIFTETPLKSAFTIDLEPREDSRGLFARAFCQHEFAAHGLRPIIAQAQRGL
jgi:dTDP-4-dehydrorhamnose 3,5-epimerase